MEVKNKQSSLISNLEINSLINDLKNSSDPQLKLNTNLATLMYELSQYFNDNETISKPNLIELLNELNNKFPNKLTKAEKLMIVNILPDTLLQLVLILKDCEERLSEEEIQNLIELINNYIFKTDESTEVNENKDDDMIPDE